MLKVIVHSDEVKVKSGTSARTGRPYSIREQEAFVQLANQPYPQKVKLALGDDEPPYQPGVYGIDTGSFFVGRYDELQVRLRLDRSSRQTASQPKAVGQ